MVSENSSANTLTNNLIQEQNKLNIDENLNQINQTQIFDFQKEDSSLFNQGFTGDMDIGNVLSAFHPVSVNPTDTILNKLSYFTPGYLYDGLDIFSRDALLYLSNDLGWGMSYAIIGISLGIKSVYMPFMVMMQRNAIKLKLLEPEMQNFQQMQTKLSRTGDYAQLRVVSKQMSQLKKSNGIFNWIAFVQLSQIPFLITWFLSLRYLASMPDKYPELLTDGILWFRNLAEMDPYFILPVLNASLSYMNISYNPNLSSSQSMTIFGKYMRYMKFLPLLSLPVVVFFPACLNLYWCITSSTHLSVTLLARSQFMRTIFKIPEYLPGSILEKMNSKHKTKIIKTIIQNDKPAAPNNVQQNIKLDEKKEQLKQNDNSQTQQTNAKNVNDKAQSPKIQQQQQSQQKPVAQSANKNTGETVIVYKNKPKKIK